MGFKKKETTESTTFCYTLRLVCEDWQRDQLDTIFQVHNHLKNALIAKKSKAITQMEREQKWKQINDRISEYLEHVPRKKADRSPEEQLGLDKLNLEKRALLEKYGLTPGQFEKDSGKMAKHYRGIININTAQKIAANVWSSARSVIYGKGKKMSFSKIDEFTMIEGKSNATGIRYKDDFLYITKLKLKVSPPRSDTYKYHEQCMDRNIHFCKVVREWSPDGWHYYLQLVLGGEPPIKVHQDTGELLHSLGHGRVGNDIGPQTIATVSDNTVKMSILADKAQDIQRELRRINRAMDRSRRAMNPDMFTADGQIVPIDKLPSSCVYTGRDKKLHRAWKDSKRYLKLKALRKYLYRKQQEARIHSHRTLANYLISLGDTHYIETMNWAALAKKAKAQSEEDRKAGKKPKSRKRFGKSIANRAPAAFVKIYQQKVEAAGGTFLKINTAKARASQYDHKSKTYKKKPLSQRRHEFEDGTWVQRDLYSAFLIQNTNSELTGFIQELLDVKFKHFKELHDLEIESLKHQRMPSSVGVKHAA